MTEHREVPPLPPLETVCPECRGTGLIGTEGDWIRCLTCDGYGHIPTEWADPLARFVIHFSRPATPSQSNW